MNLLKKTIVAAVPVFLLGGCVSTHQAAVDKGATCPKTGFLKGTDRLKTSDYEVVITGLGGGCNFGEDVVVLDTSFFVAVKWLKDTVDQPDTVSIPYVATILDEAGEITAHTRFDAKVEMVDGFGDSKEELRQRIPITEALTASKYKVVYSLYDGTSQDVTY